MHLLPVCVKARRLRFRSKSDQQSKQAHPTTHYIWRTKGDDKVRPEHASREGKIFAWNDPAIQPPGTEYGYRCTAIPYHGIVDPPIEPAYPELLLLPLFRIGRLLSAWRALGRQHVTSRNWKLGSHKTPVKWRNRLEKGEWTLEKIHVP